MTRPLVLAAAMLLAVGVCAWLAFRTSQNPTAHPVATHTVSPASDRESGQPSTALNASTGDPAMASRSGVITDTVATAGSDAGASTASDETIVRGRLLEESGNPVSGAVVALFSMRGNWGHGYEGPSIKFLDLDVRGFGSTTGSDGRFEFHTPLPTADWITLRVEPTEYYGVWAREFGPAGGRNQPRLILGLNDLGDVVIPATGAVKGRVIDSDGSRIAKASIYIKNLQSGGQRPLTIADGNGEFELGHVPEGTRELTAEKEGWLTGTLKDIVVRPNATTGGVEFKLDRAPTISGIAVDEAGVPQVGVYVFGRPVGSGPLARALTKDDGTFTMSLVQNVPHVLEVAGQSDYEHWSGFGSSDAVFDAGRRDLRIILKRAPRFTFRVVDAATSTPVERYGIAIEPLPTERYSFGRFSKTPEVEEHPGGTVERGAIPATQEVGIVAPGYAPLQALVESDPGASLFQTLRLAKAGTISATVMVANRPIANAVLILSGDRLKIDPSLPDDKIEFLDPNKRLDVSELAGREQQFATDAKGAIHIDGLAAGTYRMTIIGRGAALRDLRTIVVANGGTTDLGIIQLEPESTIHGQVLLKPGLSGSGLSVWLDEIGDRMTRVSFDGRFSFEGVQAGDHVLHLGIHPPDVLQPISRSVTVGPGGVAEVIFDLTTSAPCDVELTVLEDGQGVPGLTARWMIGEGFEVPPEKLGKSDKRGVVRGTCPADSDVRFEVFSPAGLRLGRSVDAATLSVGGSYSERMDLRVGTLVLVLPAKLDIPESGYVELELVQKDGDIQGVKCGTPGSRDQSPGAPMWKDNRLELGEIAVGEYQATVSKHRTKKRDGNWISVGMGARFEGEIRVEEGRTTIIEVP